MAGVRPLPCPEQSERYVARANELLDPPARLLLVVGEQTKDRLEIEEARGALSDQRRVAAELPVLGTCAQSGTDWIHRDVGDEPEQMGVARDVDRRESRAEHVSVTRVVLVETRAVEPVQPLHAGRKVRLRSREQQVIVRAHDAIEVAAP